MTSDAHALGQHLLSKTLDRARGRDTAYCSGDTPENKYYVSNLAPEYGRTSEDDFEAKTKPVSHGLECKPVPGTTGRMELSFDLYYPSFPTFEEFDSLRKQGLQSARIEVADREDVDPSEVSVEEVPEDSLYSLSEPFYRRFTVTYEFTGDLSQLHKNVEDIEAKINACVREQFETEAETYLVAASPAAGENLSTDPRELLECDREAFEALADRVPAAPTDEYDWGVGFTARSEDGQLTVELLNKPGASKGEDDDPFIFNPKIVVEADLEPYTFDLVPEDYRYDQNVWGKGHNCSVKTKAETSPIRVETTAVPSAPVYEFEFNTEYDTDFDDLAGSDCVETLKLIAEGMDEYYEEWTSSRRAEIIDEMDLTEEEAAELDRAAEEFADEIDRFEHGIEIIQRDKDARRAFRAMNQVNADQHDFPGWRLFQLVFIVSNLSGIVRREHEWAETDYDDIADVLWFPTGGGKTEAYLGLILFNLFYDRLRGKNRGVTAWIRFPLRLLSRQQKDRFIESMLYAEQLRRDPDWFDGVGTEFSLGFYVGGQDTPNAIGTERDTLRDAFQESHEKLEQECRVLEVCPLCESEIEIEYDAEKNSVFHRCSGDSCIDQIPLYVVDRDIYRYIPSVLLGSLDKISVMGMQPRFANLLGNVTTYCPDHGYGYSGSCSEKDLFDCEDKLQEVSEGFYDPVPTLHLIDEVHLLNEELGTFASHYETTYFTLCEQIHGETPKIVTSTATISKYERQIRNLFQRDAVRFPSDGPVRGETFYGHLTDEVEREYLGLMPANRSHLYAVLDTVADLHEIIRDLREMPASELGAEVGIDDLGEDQKTELLDLYETSLVYFNNKTRKDRYRENITKYVNPKLKRDGYRHALVERQLTADTENPEFLEQLEDPEGIPFENRIDTVPSTSFIGHGIDVDRFNLMLFYGYPRQTFQYIQSSSRVGRQSGIPGFVLDVFDPIKDRDKHRFRYFEKMHEYLDRTVEPVPIDRWAKFGIERTFTGIFKSLLLQRYRPELHRNYEIETDDGTERANVQKATHLLELMRGDEYDEITEENLVTDVKAAYGLGQGKTTNRYFEDQVELRVSKVWQFWENELSGMHYPEFPEGEEPMQNLRDIGEQGSITPQYNNQEFIRRLTEGN
ncbi:DEAD/DEAH box helicase family protein [Halomicrobium salinisoli]|uniref:DEAD/DEAH box helicase family protein n=1 Tax=Halomicrobium salinisoli TaxID=2878391 RepID=UPI001CF045A0|nr:helicase-related protein [Halomicrobium salinisoli]